MPRKNQTAINCPYHQITPQSLHEAATLIVGYDAIPLGQSWRTELQPGFLPASVKVFWTGEGLGVCAELHDRDIFNDANGENQKFWRTGDVFELFLRPLPGEKYWEFHVTPNNHRLQLAFQSEAFFRTLHLDGPEDWPPGLCLPPNSFESKALMMKERNIWQAYAFVPWSLFGLPRKVGKGDRWLASFCRYDYSRGVDKPVLSTTAFSSKLDFHDNNSWRVLEFC